MRLHSMVIAVVVSGWAHAAVAQQAAPSPEFLQQALDLVAIQRNEALNKAAIADATGRMLVQEVERLKGRVGTLEKELADEKAKNAAATPPAPAK